MRVSTSAPSQFRDFFGSGSGGGGAFGGADAADDQDEEARRRAAANRGEAYDMTRGGVNRASTESADDAAIRKQLRDIASGQGGAGGERARQAEVAKASDQAAAAAGARALQMQQSGVSGVNANRANAGFNIQNLTMQQQDVQRARQGFDAQFGAQQAQDQMRAATQLGGYNRDEDMMRMSAEEQLRQMLLEEEFDPRNLAPKTTTAPRRIGTLGGF